MSPVTKAFRIIEAPSILGLKPTGVQLLPEALVRAGLQRALRAEHGGTIAPLPYNPQRDAKTGILNPSALRTHSLGLASIVEDALRAQRFPLVLGGDCSNIIGIMLGLKRLGRYGLIYIDGHADFYQPAAEPTGEVASMGLAIVTGRGPEVITDIDGHGPYVRDEDAVAFGFRDVEQQREHGSQNVRETAILALELEEIRARGVSVAAEDAARVLSENGVDGFWIHIDADVLDDAIMPAVDYRLAGGVTWNELREILHALMDSTGAVGANVGIFNPALDPDGSIARALVSCLTDGLAR